MRFLLLGLLLALFGCAAQEETDAPVDEAYCSAGCARYDEACGDTDSGCVSRCVAANEHLSRMTPAASEAIAECVSEDSCSSLEGGSAHCFSEAAETLEGTDAQKRFCSDYIERGFECRWYVTVDECTGWFALWGDAVMSSLDPCLSEECDAISDCIDEKLRGES
jgi:hypothetical protein